MAIPRIITKENIAAALKFIDEYPAPPENKSIRYLLSNDGRFYPPKYVIAVAKHIATGEAISTNGFNAVEAKNRLIKLGFEIIENEDDALQNCIVNEKNEARKHTLATIKSKNGERLVELSLENVGKVEAMIAADSAYLRVANPTEKPMVKPNGTIEYRGSTAFWMTLLKNALDDLDGNLETTYGCQFDQANIGFTFPEILAGAIVAVDMENKTHLTTDGVGRIEIMDRICSISKLELKQGLRNRDEAMSLRPLAPRENLFRLIEGKTYNNDEEYSNDISDYRDLEFRKDMNRRHVNKFKQHEWLYTLVKAEDTKNPKKEFPDNRKKWFKPRENTSFASKFCHYACFYVFEGEKEQDNFSIYDDVLETVLPQYWAFFDVGNLTKHSGKFDYKEYSDVIDEIRGKSSRKGYTISRNGFDHLLWYYHKGRLDLDEDPTP